MMYLRPGFVVVIVGATLTSISTVIVALRYYCRYFLMGSVGPADHLMFVALVLTWGNFVVNFYQDDSSKHFRPSAFKNPAKRPAIEIQVRRTLIAWWVYRMSYIFALGFVKLSILFFYRAIASQRTFRRLVHATMAFVSMYTVAAVLASAFQCQHPSNSWSTKGYFAQFDGNPKTKPPKVKCFDPVRLWCFSTAANLLTDVVIMLLPLPALLSLRVPMSKRIALIGIFSIGMVAIVASSVRVWVLMLWAMSPAAAARYGADLLLWGQVETNSGIISASVPFLRLLFKSRKKEERGVMERRVVDIGPPKPMGQDDLTQTILPEIETYHFFEDEKEREKEKEKEQEQKLEAGMWNPFITVPESLSSGSRGSARLEPVQRPHSTL